MFEVIVFLLIFWGISEIFRLTIGASIKRDFQNTESECDRHSWKYKPVDDSSEELGTYLVCTKCKNLPGGGKEQS